MPSIRGDALYSIAQSLVMCQYSEIAQRIDAVVGYRWRVGLLEIRSRVDAYAISLRAIGERSTDLSRPSE